jgi:hypothetical protein
MFVNAKQMVAMFIAIIALSLLSFEAGVAYSGNNGA